MYERQGYDNRITSTRLHEFPYTELCTMVYEKLHESNQLIDLSRFLHAAAERNETLPVHKKASNVA